MLEKFKVPRRVYLSKDSPAVSPGAIQHMAALQEPRPDLLGARRGFKTGDALTPEKFKLRRMRLMLLVEKSDHRVMLRRAGRAISKPPRIGGQQQLDQRTQMGLQPVKTGGQR